MTGKLTLRGLPHLPGVPHLHVNTPLNIYCWCNLCWKVPWVPETFHARSLRVTCFATHDFGLQAKTPHARKDLWNLYKILRNCPPTPPLNQSSHKFLVTWLQTLSPFLACLPPNPPLLHSLLTVWHQQKLDWASTKYQSRHKNWKKHFNI